MTTNERCDLACVVVAALRYDKARYRVGVYRDYQSTAILLTVDTVRPDKSGRWTTNSAAIGPDWFDSTLPEQLQAKLDGLILEIESMEASQ